MIPSATDRFKVLMADALERICVLEEKWEKAEARVAELEAKYEPSASDSTVEP